MALQMFFPIKPPFIMDFPVRYVSHYQRVSWKFCAATWTGGWSSQLWYYWGRIGWLPMEWFVVFLIIEFPKNLAVLLQIVEICEVKGGDLKGLRGISVKSANVQLRGWKGCILYHPGDPNGHFAKGNDDCIQLGELGGPWYPMFGQTRQSIWMCLKIVYP